MLHAAHNVTCTRERMYIHLQRMEERKNMKRKKLKKKMIKLRYEVKVPYI